MRSHGAVSPPCSSTTHGPRLVVVQRFMHPAQPCDSLDGTPCLRHSALPVPVAINRQRQPRASNAVQAASSGKLHKAWEQIFDEAAGAPLVRVYVAGRLILVATTPEAFDAITRKLKFTPKMRAAYAGFPFLVREALFRPPYRLAVRGGGQPLPSLRVVPCKAVMTVGTGGGPRARARGVPCEGAIDEVSAPRIANPDTRPSCARCRSTCKGYERAGSSLHTLQGYREPNMFTTDDAEEHARVRKELSVFFSTENILSVISKLTSLMRAACTDAVEAASRAPDGAAHVNIVALATNIIDAVVREVRSDCAAVRCAPACSGALWASSLPARWKVTVSCAAWLFRCSSRRTSWCRTQPFWTGSLRYA